MIRNSARGASSTVLHRHTHTQEKLDRRDRRDREKRRGEREETENRE